MKHRAIKWLLKKTGIHDFVTQYIDPRDVKKDVVLH